MRLLSAVAASVACTLARARPVLPVPEFQINLDVDPEERFKEVVEHFKPTLLDLVDSMASSSIVKGLYHKIAQHRGPENEELAAEIRGISKYSGVPLEDIQTAQLLYELQTVMVPVENITWPWGETTDTSGVQSGFGCTGVIARSADDSTVTHARNLDFSFAKWLANMTYNAVFSKGGKVLYTAQMIAAYQAVLTGMRRGDNGYTIEINTRFPSKQTGVHSLLQNLFVEKRTTSGWIKRKVLEEVNNFEDAVTAFSTHAYAAPEYNVISGNQKGVILARNPNDVYHTLTLGPNNNDYIVITNMDYWDHDIKEWLDPTSIHFGHSRRVGAQKLLNASSNINEDYLRKVMNDDEVVAKDTIFQAYMNVQKDTYKTELPNCEDCSGCRDDNKCLQKGEDCCGVRSHYTKDCGGFIGGGYRCGCLPDGACRAATFGRNSSKGDEDCCSFTSHFSTKCGALGMGARRCGPKPADEEELTIV